jgi:RNA polymerase sigma factor (sigma-70 family)
MKSSDDFLPTRRSLLTRLKDWDDNESWKTFFDTYWKLIYGAAIKSGLSDAEAQDVVQETVLSVAKKMHEFKYDPAAGSFKGWLMQLTKWRITDQFRKRPQWEDKNMGGNEGTSRTATIERFPDENSLNLEAIWELDWQKNLRDAALQRVRRKANARQYQIFDLYVVKEWPVRDVVKTLGISSHQVYKAKERISALLKEEIEYLQTKMI